MTSIDPENCTDMAEVRAGVDGVDAAIVALLARRFAYMEAAARIKRDRETVRDDARKQQVIDNVRAASIAAAIPAEAIVEIWDRLVEASIAFELNAWDILHTPKVPYDID